MATPVQAIGTTLSWNSQLVAKLTKIGGIEVSLSTIDVTTHNSSGYYTEFIPGMFTAGDVAIEGYFDYGDTNGQIAMITDFNARTSRTFVITFPASTGSTWTGTGYITAISVQDPGIDGVIPFTATIKPTGQPTFAIATSTGLTTPFFAMSNSAVIAPTLSGSTYDYVATVLTDVTSVTITPTASAGVITVNGATVTSGQASGAITLGEAGSITTATIVVTETNKAPKTYTIRIVRAAA